MAEVPKTQRDIAGRFMERVVREGDVAAAPEFFFDPSQPIVGEVQRGIRKLHDRLSDLNVAITHVDTQPDHVVVSHQIRGTLAEGDEAAVNVDAVANFQFREGKLMSVSGYLSESADKYQLLGDPDDEEIWPYGIRPPNEPTM